MGRENMSDERVKNRVMRTARTLDMMSAMGMNRKERRYLAKKNGTMRIVGSMKPFVKEKD